MASELHGMLAGNVSMVTGDNMKPAYGGEEEIFLRKVVTPIYNVISQVPTQTGVISAYLRLFLDSILWFCKVLEFVLYLWWVPISFNIFMCVQLDSRRLRKTEMALHHIRSGVTTMIWMSISGTNLVPSFDIYTLERSLSEGHYAPRNCKGMEGGGILQGSHLEIAGRLIAFNWAGQCVRMATSSSHLMLLAGNLLYLRCASPCFSSIFGFLFLLHSRIDMAKLMWHIWGCF